MLPVFFADQAEFRKWLEENHKTQTEILVGFYKVNSGKQNMTWSESVDQALCFGWIDGVRRSVDETSYCIRFTPRKPSSNWSTVNIKKIESLTKKGLIHPAGLEAFNKRKPEKSGVYSYENDFERQAESYKKMLQTNRKAWDFYSKQAPSYQKMVLRWILSARQENTRLSRLEKAITESENHKRLFDQYK